MSTLTVVQDATVQQPAADRARTVSTGIALIAAPVLLIVANLLSTPGDNTTAQYMSTLVGRASIEQISIICFLLGFTMFIPATFGLLAMLPARGRALGRIGAWLVAIGSMAYAGLVSSGITNIGLAKSLPANQAAHLVTQIGNVGAAGVLFAIALALPVGMILSTSAARRGRLTALWVPIVTALGFVTVLFVESTAGGVAGDVLMVASLGYLGVRLLTGATDGTSADV